MPQPHSGFYLYLQNHSLIDWLNDAPLPPCPDRPDGHSSYDQVSDYLRERHDAYFGIVSRLNERNEWVRDATAALPLNERRRHDDPIIEATNAQLRCLSRLRPIDYAIGRQGQPGEGVRAQRETLKMKLAEHIQGIQNIVDSKMKKAAKREAILDIENEFNLILIDALTAAGLNIDCKERAEQEKLLFHYRNLSSLMLPARPMITLSWDEEAGVLQRDTQYPVTVKAPMHVAGVHSLKRISDRRVRSLASQHADVVFAELITANDRALPAQARKTIMVGGIYNGYLVESALFPKRPDQYIEGEDAQDVNTLWLARTGSPAYVGKGENSETVNRYALANLQQIRNTASHYMQPLVRLDKDASASALSDLPPPLHMHITCLNTNTVLQDQDIIVKSIRRAVSQVPGDHMSYLPTNAHGLTKPVEISQELVFDKTHKKPKGRDVGMKADRVTGAANVILMAAALPHTLSVVNCASGQDRTGTAVEEATQLWMAERYKAYGKDPKTIGTLRALGGNAAEITTHHVHGAPGMKKDSQASNFLGKDLFPPEASKEQYRPSAKFNKAPRVPSRGSRVQAKSLALGDYARLLKAYDETVQNLDLKHRELAHSAARLSETIRDIAGGHPERLSLKHLGQLNQVLIHATGAIKAPEQVRHRTELERLSREVSGRKSPLWKALGAAMMVFALLVLVVAVPVMASTAVGSGAAIGTGVGAFFLGYAGLGFFNNSGQRGLSKAVADFHETSAPEPTPTPPAP